MIPPYERTGLETVSFANSFGFCETSLLGLCEDWRIKYVDMNTFINSVVKSAANSLSLRGGSENGYEQHSYAYSWDHWIWLSLLVLLIGDAPSRRHASSF